MNLIEQLGGYSVVKEKYQSLSDSDVITIGPVEFSAKDYFKEELLDYRRQHNIYEVWDWVVMDSHKPEYQFYQITKDDMGSHWINLAEFRHATDDEIKAGKRLSAV